MGRDKALKPPIAAIIYGEFAFWLTIIGMIISIVGSTIYFISGGYLNKACLLVHLWQGADSHTIWEECAGVTEAFQSYWYLGMLSQGDAIAMLGIATCCIAAVLGMWGASFGMVRSKGGIYIIFALIIAVVLTLSALGLITLGH